MAVLGRSPSLISLANDKVSIITACRYAGVEVSGDGESMKIHCPFELFHSDRGMARAMRVYPATNHAWCFACSAHFTPVKLTAQHRDIDWTTAATLLLDHIGYRPVSLADQWARLVEHEPQPDRALLADALKTYCLRVVPGWERRQFDRDEAAMLTRCLALLDRVRTAEQARQWLQTTKTVMSQQFADAHSSALQ